MIRPPSLSVPPWFRDLIDGGLDPDGSDLGMRSLRRRMRMLNLGTLALCGFGLVIAIQFAWNGFYAIGIRIVPAAAIGVANLIYARRTQRVDFSGQVAVGCLYLFIGVAALSGGGFREPGFAWLYTVPVAATCLVNLRAGWLWSGVVALTTVGFWGMAASGVEVLNLMPFAESPGQHLVNRLGTIAMLSMLASLLVLGQRQAERELVWSNSRLRREASHVELLQHAVVAANEARSGYEALTSCVERICRTMGWHFGQVYVLASSEGERLVASDICYVADPSRFSVLVAATRAAGYARGEGLPGQALSQGIPLWMATAGPELRDDARMRHAREAGLQAGVAFPVVADGRVRAVVECYSERVPEDDGVPRLLEVLALIGEQLGRVAERDQMQERLRLSQKMQAVGQLAAGIAHEINNPMAYVRANLSLLRSEWDTLRDGIEKLERNAGTAIEAERGPGEHMAECEELLDEALEGVDRTIEIVKEVKEFSHTGHSERTLTDVREVIEQAMRTALASQPDGVEIESDLRRLPRIVASAGQLRRVFVNLIVNAAQAVGPRGKVRVSCERVEDEACIRVEDDGCGIPEDIRTRLFDPFFTTKPAGEGTGLGLYISYEIVRLHGGEILVESTPGKGASFEVRLPLSASETVRAASPH